MANTLQAKKRVRRNTTREGINKSRRSRIRSFVKKVGSDKKLPRVDYFL